MTATLSRCTRGGGERFKREGKTIKRQESQGIRHSREKRHSSCEKARRRQASGHLFGCHGGKGLQSSLQLRLLPSGHQGIVLLNAVAELQMWGEVKQGEGYELRSSKGWGSKMKRGRTRRRHTQGRLPKSKPTLFPSPRPASSLKSFSAVLTPMSTAPGSEWLHSPTAVRNSAKLRACASACCRTLPWPRPRLSGALG